MAYYYKVSDSENEFPLHKGFHLQKLKKLKTSGPKITYDFSKHVLIELLDDTTPEAELWSELGLINNSNIIHKRMMLDSHRMKCRRAVVICTNSDEAKQLAYRISQSKIMGRCVCAVVIEDLLSDLCLFEKQIIQFGDCRFQQQLLYVSDLNRCRGPTGLVKFLKEAFSPFGTILSVLVCADDDGYAFPEGVIKFAYLSEAFAAELAFDQYVLGKERLSVTTHHNILLSQCDLRVRLRDAQWCNNPEYNNTSSKSLFQCCNETCEQNDLDICNNDPAINSMNNLHMSHISNNLEAIESNLLDDRSEVSLPDFSQYNFEINIPKKCHHKNTHYANKQTSNRRIEHTVSIPYRNVTSDLNTDMNKSINSSSKSSSLHFSHKISIRSSETRPIDANTTKSTIQKKKSRFHTNLNSLTSSKKTPKFISDTDTFTTSETFLDSSSNSFFPPSKNTLHNSLHSDEISGKAKYECVLSDCKQISSLHNDNFNGSNDGNKSLAKESKKRRKKFTPSQKLCLKSQRTGLSQGDFQSTSARSEFSVSCSSQPEKSLQRDKLHEPPCKKDLNFSCLSSNSSKVADWLSNIPVLQSLTPSCEKEESKNIETINEKSEQNNKKHNNRISIYRAPSIKSNLIKSFDHHNSSPDDNCLENEDPNKKPLILPKESLSDSLEKSTSPLQAWLKQELMFSTNNRIVRSQETSKSIIVCATRTKDVIIAVGCSHMTCDSCYPESTDLLLGYN